MTRYTVFPILVKVLHIYYSRMCWNGYSEKTVKGTTITIGTYYVAEHSKTPGLDKGDKFIIKEHYIDV